MRGDGGVDFFLPPSFYIYYFWIWGFDADEEDEKQASEVKMGCVERISVYFSFYNLRSLAK